MKKTSIFALVLFMFFPAGCASLRTGYETPVVTITSFETLPSQGIMPRFRIDLHIVNPNRSPLKLNGISYTIALEDHNILTGVSNKLPQIEPYGEGDVSLDTSVDLFSSIRFLSDIIQNKKNKSLTYTFKAKLDTGTLYPLIKVEKRGTLSLDD